MTTFSFIAYGVCVGVHLQNANLMPCVFEHLPPNWKHISGSKVDCLYSIKSVESNEQGLPKRHGRKRPIYVLYRDDEFIAQSFDIELLFEMFESNLQIYVAEMSPHKVFVHAGVVGWHGKAILIPGRSMSGKTTLVRELIRAGARYYSDEYAVLDERGRVHPYAKPLAIRNVETMRQAKYKVEELGGLVGTDLLPVGLIVVSQYKRCARRWRPRRLSEGRGALELLDNAVSVRRQPKKAIAALQQIVCRAPIIKGTRGEASEVVEAILASLNED